MKNKNKYLLVIGIMLFAFIVIGVTYAIYRPNVTKINDTETVIKTNELGLVYTGPESLSCSNMIPGDKCIKHFTVENTSNVAVTYNIYMEQITNEFNEDLVYTLTDNNGSVVGETPLPITNSNKSYLKKDISINAKTTKNYTITIEFKYTNQPQNDMQGAEFRATIGIDTEQNANANKIICKVATELDKENDITYGSIYDGESLKGGDAFDCDVDGTGYNKRFYYLRNVDSNTAALIYSNNTKGGDDNTTVTTTYNSGANVDGPLTAVTHLPTKSDWSNIDITDITINLKNTNNEIYKENYKYEGYAARLLSFDDIKDACGVSIGTNTINELEHCKFLFQNMSVLQDNYWTDISYHYAESDATGVMMNASYGGYFFHPSGVSTAYKVRPVIHVNIDNLNTKFPETGTLKLGDYVKMTPDIDEFEMTREETGYYPLYSTDPVQEIQKHYPSQINTWRVINLKSDGTAELIADDASTEPVYFFGVEGYAKSVGTLNYIASKYENSKYTVGSRSFGYDGQTEYITDTSSITAKHSDMVWNPNNVGYCCLYQVPEYERLGGGDKSYVKDEQLVINALGSLSTKNNKVYFFASRSTLYSGFEDWEFQLRQFVSDHIAELSIVNNTKGIIIDRGLNSAQSLPGRYVRPIVILKSGLKYNGLGTEENPYIIKGDTHQY